ncbi:ribonuclease E/G-like protein chloroplastic-like, partial [Trifolium medium]|nr:ribonuclease E/G-like protein chloroplastic-like [Trifolium medium]
VNRIIVCEDWENAELQKIVEENRLSQTTEEPQVLSEVSTSTEISDNSRDEKEFDLSNISGIEDTKIYAEEKPIDGTISSSMEKPMAIIAENIGSSEDHTESKSHETNKKNVIRKSEESEDGPQNDDRINDLGYNGNVAGLKNWEGTIVEGSLIDFEGGPVLVPGLTPPTEEETSPGEVVEEEKTAIEPSIEAFETQDQNIPEVTT